MDNVQQIYGRYTEDKLDQGLKYPAIQQEQ
jgi:hypothetical protein